MKYLYWAKGCLNMATTVSNNSIVTFKMKALQLDKVLRSSHNLCPIIRAIGNAITNICDSTKALSFTSLFVSLCANLFTPYVKAELLSEATFEAIWGADIIMAAKAIPIMINPFLDNRLCNGLNNKNGINNNVAAWVNTAQTAAIQSFRCILP